LRLGPTSLGTSSCAGIKRCSDIRIATLSQRTALTTSLLPPGSELPRVAMAEFRLTDRARADLIETYDVTERKFGAYQADAYYAGLIRSFGLLADFPRIGQAVDELAIGYRRFRFQSHLIFYTIQPDHVEIRAVVHSAQDIRPQLFD
jgi:toxin ParE1/3/4